MEYGPPPLFRQGMSVRIRFLLSVLAAIILILVDGRLRAVDGFRSALVSFTTPLVEVVAAPARFIGEYENYFTSKRTLSDENQRLKVENQLLLLRAARLNELEVENARLRSLVEAVPRTTSHTKTAEVLGRVSDPFVSRLQINLGERDGLVTGMPVIGVYGVLGQVNRTVLHQAEVRLLTEQHQQISVVNERTGVHYIATGTGEPELDLLFVRQDDDLRAGDRLVTSGFDKIFPRNIAVATVTSVTHTPGETYQRVSASPGAITDDIQFATVILVDPNPTAALEAQTEEKQPFERRRRR